MPKIIIYPQGSPTLKHTWRCDIEDGPGHHGTGASKPEALFNAARAWRIYEENHGSKKET